MLGLLSDAVLNWAELFKQHWLRYRTRKFFGVLRVFYLKIMCRNWYLPFLMTWAKYTNSFALISLFCSFLTKPWHSKFWPKNLRHSCQQFFEHFKLHARAPASAHDFSPYRRMMYIKCEFRNQTSFNTFSILDIVFRNTFLCSYTSNINKISYFPDPWTSAWLRHF